LHPDAFIGAMKRIQKDRLKQNNNFDKAKKWEEVRIFPLLWSLSETINP
jgi:type IV secretory pathway component VirB8